MQIPVWKGVVVAMPGTWLTNRPGCLLFASVNAMGGPHFLLGAVETGSGGKSCPQRQCLLPNAEQRFPACPQHTQGLYPRICDPAICLAVLMGETAWVALCHGKRELAACGLEQPPAVPVA